MRFHLISCSRCFKFQLNIASIISEFTLIHETRKRNVCFVFVEQIGPVKTHFPRTKQTPAPRGSNPSTAFRFRFREQIGLAEHTHKKILHVLRSTNLLPTNTTTELMIRRLQFIRRTKEAATQAACAGNARGYHSEYGNSWFNNRETMTRIICFDHIIILHILPRVISRVISCASHSDADQQRNTLS